MHGTSRFHPGPYTPFFGPTVKGQRIVVTARQRETVNMIRKLAKIMRKEEPIEWCGLRKEMGKQPSRVVAHLFFLEAAVDGGRQRADTAWRAAQAFVLGIIPRRQRGRVWDWIVEEHSFRRWQRHRSVYALHRTQAWHDRVYRLAEFMSKNLHGDPRNIWRQVPGDVEPIDYVRSVLH